MARKEPKLRPSLSWSEMQILITALESTVRQHVVANSVTTETVEMVKLQEYIKTFEPFVTKDSMAEVMARLKQQHTASNVSKAANPEQAVSVPETNDIDTLLPANNLEPVTKEQRYQMLKLRDEKTFSDDDKAFYMEYGFMKMLAESKTSPVDSGDL